MLAKFRRSSISSSIILGVLSLGLSSCGVDLDKPKRTPEVEMQMNREIRQAMQRIQVSAEHYAADHGGENYPTKLDDEFKSYLPGGEEGKRPAPVGAVNIFSGKNEFPLISTANGVHAIRFGQRFNCNPGQIVYCPLQNGEAYLIYGGASDGKVMMDEKNPGEILVLSNLED